MDSSISISDCSFHGNLNGPSAAASCIDATQSFSGSLTITNSTFIAGNGAPGSSSVPAPPVAVTCSAGGSPTTCGVTVEPAPV
ncbi:MAG: hypothetical protein WDW36_009442 [Sanguina aurantia]